MTAALFVVLTVAGAAWLWFRGGGREDFAGLDREFYGDATTALEREGFVHVADVIDVTMRRAFPHLHSVGRILVLAHYRKGVGPLTEDELKALVGRRLHAHEQELVDAVTQRWATRG